MDAQEKLAYESKFCVAVLLGKDETGDQHIHLVTVGSRLSDEASALLLRHKCEYIGAIGIMPSGFVDAEPVDHTSETVAAMCSAIPRFFEIATNKGVFARRGDGVEWLTRLLELPDTRTN
jgi:hypothetical protein